MEHMGEFRELSYGCSKVQEEEKRISMQRVWGGRKRKV
jgi:hypothetical protein